MKNLTLLALTIILFGTSIFFRKLAVDRIHPYQLQIVAGAVYALEIPIWLYLIKQNNIVGYDTLGVVFGVLCLITYVVAAVLLGTLLKGSNNTGMIATMVAMNPLITSMLSVMFLGEQFGPKKIAATIVMMIGFILFNV